MNPWKIISLIVVSFVVGVVHNFVKPQLEGLVPESWRNTWYTQAFFNGAFILLAVIVSATALRIVGGKKLAGAV